MAPPSSELLSIIPAETARKHRVIPLSVSSGSMEVGAGRMPDPAVLRDLAFITGKKIIPVLVDPSEIEAFIARHYPSGLLPGPAETGRGAAEPAGDHSTTRPDRAGTGGDKPAAKTFARQFSGSVVQQVNQIIQSAIEMRASDIHIEPYEKQFRVRYRLDGVLHTTGELTLLQKDEVISRLKIMASLDIAEKRRPQDGRIRVKREDHAIDIRVSTLPTTFGEKIVLRILDRSGLSLDLQALGFGDESLRMFRRSIQSPYGMILVTGPTGSGKTTTLYAALSELNTSEVNITTIEDPIEYNLPGVNQVHVRSDIGFTFAQALRAFLRQDPNIIMVGEIRDAETAEIAVRAALTGHLVLSTLHTNDAPSTVTRLVDMGIEPFLVASSVRLVMAQRLVRKICPSCKVAEKPDPALLEQLQMQPEPGALHRGRGCDACSGTGYKGRTALYELMPVSESIADLIVQRAGAAEVRKQARQGGMLTLREAALLRIREGITTPEEALRETMI